MTRYNTKNMINNLLIVLIGITLPIPQFRVAVFSFEVPIYMMLMFLYLIANIRSVKANKIPKNTIYIIFYFLVSILITSSINAPNYPININLVLKYVINSVFMIVLFINNFSEKQIMKLFKISSFIFFIYILLTIYLYTILNNKDYIGVDFVNFTTNGRNSLSILLGVYLITSLFIVENRLIKTMFTLTFSIATLLLQSRGLIISIILILIIYLVSHVKKKKSFVMVKNIFFVIIVLLISYFVIRNFVNVDVILNRLKTINIFNANYDSVSSNYSRKLIFQKGLEIISNNLMFGVGIGNFGNYISPIIGTSHVAHNDYMGLVSELGLFGVVFIIITFGKLFYISIKNIFNKDEKQIILYLSIINLFFLLYMFFIDLFNTPFYWLFLSFFIIEMEKSKKNRGLKLKL